MRVSIDQSGETYARRRHMNTRTENELESGNGVSHEV